jgi:hypothetical protein
MPYMPKNEGFDPQQELPMHLDHKPIYALPYEKFDGMYAADTDIRYISIGLAQYDHDSISIKTMRHTGEKWTRQAEELPLHRPIDMTLFLAKALFDSADRKLLIAKGTLQDQTKDIEIMQESEVVKNTIKHYDSYLNQHGAFLKKRLNALLDVLQDLKNRGAI